MPYAELMASLHTPAVRDLAWLLFSPHLLAARAFPSLLAEPAPGDAAPSRVAAWLEVLDREPAPLTEYLAVQPQTRVGLYAERLLRFYVQHGSTYELLAAGQQVQAGGRTIGECDFLLQDEGGERLHWELAVKCYLYAGAAHAGHAPDAAEHSLAQYVGPNLADRFDRKLAHMRNHQLSLSGRPELAALFPGAPWHARLLLRGWLFYPAAPDATPSPPPVLNPAHLRGWWLSVRDWRAHHAAREADGWATLPRLAWLAPARLAPTSVLSASAFERLLESHFSASAEPLLVVALHRSTTGFDEHSRGFIVPDDWPGRAQALLRSPGRLPERAPGVSATAAETAESAEAAEATEAVKTAGTARMRSGGQQALK